MRKLAFAIILKMDMDDSSYTCKYYTDILKVLF